MNIFFVFLADTSYALIVGLFFAQLWIGSRNHARLLRSLVAALIAAHLVHPWFVAASMTGATQFSVILNAVPDVITATRQGKLWMAGIVAIGLLAGILLSRLRRHAALTAALLFVLAAIKAASGHPADEGDFTLTEFSQLLHILGTATWAGAVIISGWVVLPELTRASVDTIGQYGRRLSSVVTVALAALLLSGVFTADRELNNTLSGLWNSTWGRTLLLKIAFVLIGMACGAVNRFKGVRNQPTSESNALLSKVLRIEAAVMIVILGLSALLANTAPPTMDH